MSRITIKIANQSDFKIVYDFLLMNFVPHGPMTMSHINKVDPMPPPEEFLKNSIENETTLMAFSEGKLVGVLEADRITSENKDKYDKYARNLQGKDADLFRFESYIGRKADFCNRLNVSHCLHIHALTTHLDHLRQGIGFRLFEYIVELGRSLNYPAISVDCTSCFTARIAEKFNMNCLTKISYDEYNAYIGEKLFIPKEPHTEIKSFAKVYDTN